MSSAEIYIDKDNAPELTLQQDGVTVANNVVTKAELYIPASAFSSGPAQLLDTDGANMSLITNATKVKLSLGGIGMVSGSHNTYLTIYDSASVEGTAWSKLILHVQAWPNEV